MAQYSVSMRVTVTDVVEAENEFMAAVIAAQRGGDGVEITQVRRADGRTRPNSGAKRAGNASTTPNKPRRPLSPEARARLAENLVKARAARAANTEARKKASKKASKRAAKKR